LAQRTERKSFDIAEWANTAPAAQDAQAHPTDEKTVFVEDLLQGSLIAESEGASKAALPSRSGMIFISRFSIDRALNFTIFYFS
jgi:hypothetical protein